MCVDLATKLGIIPSSLTSQVNTSIRRYIVSGSGGSFIYKEVFFIARENIANRTISDEANPICELANAIVHSAAIDYRSALKKDDKWAQKDIEDFFFSDWFQLLTNVEAKYLVDRLRKEVRGGV